MSTESKESFLNGLIAGAGIALAVLSYAFVQYVAPLENQPGISTTEPKIAILLGALVFAAAVAYEFYGKKKKKEPSEKREQGIKEEKNT